MNTLFESNQKIEKLEKERMLRREIKESPYTKEYFFKEIENEEYLWDMRCWEKPKSEYSIAEVIEQIRKWLGDDGWSYNCGHTLFCIRKLWQYGWATREEIANAVLRNNKIKYPNEIGSWGKSQKVEEVK